MTPPADPERYKNHRFPGEIISHGVWLYYRFPLSWADENQRYGDKICIGERRNFCSRARSQLRGICYGVCVRFWVK